jgi:OOP family OmpA-OmpF porin
MSIKRILISAFLFSLSSLSFSADAPSKRYYVGGGVGQSKGDDVCDGISNCDDTDIAWKLFGGYRFTQNIAIEGGYVDFGEYTGKVNTIIGTVKAKAEVSGFTAHMVGTLPLHERFSLIARLGTIYADVDVKGSAGGFNGHADDQSFAFAGGVGAEVVITDQLFARAEYELFKDLGDNDETGESDVYLASVSVGFRF